jgi:hypothetical protein
MKVLKLAIVVKVAVFFPLHFRAVTKQFMLKYTELSWRKSITIAFNAIVYEELHCSICPVIMFNVGG